MIDAYTKQTQPEASQSAREGAAQNPRHAAAVPPPSAELVRRFEQACEECGTDADTVLDEAQSQDSTTHTVNTPMTNTHCPVHTMTCASSATQVSATPVSPTPISRGQRSTHFADAHEVSSRSVAQKDAQTPRREERDGRNPLGMTHPLDNMFQPPLSSVPLAEITANTPLDDASSAVWSSLAERILVAETPQGGQEVRITLGQDILPGTEISLTRHPDGALVAVLITNNASILQTLVAGRDDLRQRLEHMGENNVQVDVRSGSDGNESDSQRRSRGLLYPDSEAEA